MTLFPDISATELAARRRKLRQRRRIGTARTIWQVLALGGLAGSLVWAIAQPDWTIRQPEQIKIEGNQFLSAAAIRSLLPLTYPQSLLRIQPQAIAAKLEAAGPIAAATVTRQLLPPGLTIQIKERQPVAVVEMPGASKQQAAGLLDAQGTWMPLESYKALDRSLPLPELKAIGCNTQYQNYWSSLYQAISRSRIKISTIDCQDPANLILQTELGTVRLGAYSDRLPEQIGALERLSALPRQIELRKIAYIDLADPSLPAIKTISPSP